MEENVIQIKSGMMINVDASVKNIIYMKKIAVRILLHVVAKMVNTYQALLAMQWLSVMKLWKKHKQPQQMLIKKQPVKHKIIQ